MVGDIGDLDGPRVRAVKGDTADSGGGLLVLRAGALHVQGPRHVRTLGRAEELTTVEFLDRHGASARFNFGGGLYWTLSSEEKGTLADFARELETRLARPALVIEPPRLSEELRGAMTTERKLEVGGLAASLVLAWLSYLVSAEVAGIGYFLLAVVILWFALLAVQREGRAGPIALPDRIAGQSWVMILAVPIALGLGGALGVLEARNRELARAVEQARLVVERARIEKEAARSAAAKLAEDARADELRDGMLAALEQGALREARERHDALKALRPEDPALGPALARMQEGLDALDEQERRLDVSVGLDEARRVIGDPVRCDSARHVADAWAKLSRATFADEDYARARDTADRLERCRKRVEAGFSQNAAALRRRERQRLAPAWQEELRARGEAASLRLEGRRGDGITVELAAFDDAHVEGLLGRADRPDTLLARMQAAGIAGVTVTDGKERSLWFELAPGDESRLGAEVMKGYGLDEPLSLPAPPAREE